MPKPDLPFGGRIPDQALRRAHNALEHHGLLGSAKDLASDLHATRDWLLLAVAVVGGVVYFLDAILEAAPPQSRA
jgi:hypothetical protein